MSLKIETHERRVGMYDVALIGRLDGETYQRLEALLAPMLKPPMRAINFELSRLDYVSSMGLRLFLATIKSAKALKGTVAMTAMQPQVKKVFEIANLLPSFSIFEGTEEADQYFDYLQRHAGDET
jgi:anti-anti-sigma factor